MYLCHNSTMLGSYKTCDSSLGIWGFQIIKWAEECFLNVSNSEHEF